MTDNAGLNMGGGGRSLGLNNDDDDDDDDDDEMRESVQSSYGTVVCCELWYS